jgi:ATPase subunit of ABC transporter with duplicated ATPase domains
VEALQQTVADAPQPRDELTIMLGSKRLGKRAIDLKKISKRWGERWVLRDLTYAIQPGARIGIVGANGAGKTTLLHIIAGILPPDAGAVEVGDTVTIGYYDQEGATLPQDKRVIEYLQATDRWHRNYSGAAIGMVFVPTQPAIWCHRQIVGWGTTPLAVASPVVGPAQCPVIGRTNQ